MTDYHDYIITRYHVDCTQQEIILELAKDEDNFEIQFKGVLGHFFEHTLPGNIINQLRPEEPEQFFQKNQSDLIRYHNFGLNFNFSSQEAFCKSITSHNLKCYSLHSSYGLSGWVIANDLRKGA